jgi:hypothetical protein
MIVPCSNSLKLGETKSLGGVYQLLISGDGARAEKRHYGDGSSRADESDMEFQELLEMRVSAQ